MTEAEHPKGIDVVKDCIRKLKLDEDIRRAEGLKTPKVSPMSMEICKMSSSLAKSNAESYEHDAIVCVVAVVLKAGGRSVSSLHKHFIIVKEAQHHFPVLNS